MKGLKISLVQCNQIWEDKEANLAHFDELLKAVQLPTDIIIFPEMFQTGFSMNPASMAESMDGESINWLKEKAKKYDSAIAASLIIKEGDYYQNRFVFVLPNGEVKTYNKRKLFTFSKEEQHYHAGNEQVIVEYKGWNILLQVCYDLRFPEIQRNNVKNGQYAYDLMINVANWPEKRSLHWRTLLQARAIENQCYVIGVNRVGEGAKGLLYSGDSMIVSPAGLIENHVSYDEMIINDEIEVETLKEVRKLLPFLKDQ